MGVTISLVSDGTGPDLGVAFDSEITGPTMDPDLQRNPPDSMMSPQRTKLYSWKGGNLSVDTNFGMLLIIQENNTGNDASSVSDPDDEVAGGTITFSFEDEID